MEFIRNLRSKVGYALLRRKVRATDRSVKAVHLYSAKKAAVVFRATGQADFELIQNFIKTMKEEGVDVSAVGFVKEKKIPNMFLLRKGYSFFCLEDLNWYCKPIAPFVESFLKEKFDILIDLNLERCLPLDYLVYLADAGFKAGKHFVGDHPFDLTIDVNKNNNLAYLIDQLQHYLSLINKPVKHETADI